MAAVDDEEGIQKQVFDLASDRKLVELRALLEKHPDVDVDGYRDWDGQTALFFILLTCNLGYTECARLLIYHRADVNAENIYGQSPMHLAALYGRLGIANLLIDHHADVSVKDVLGVSPLHAASERGHLWLCEAAGAEWG
jgi:ankyrin repeat protein